MSGFQNVINPQQAPGVEGDFASANPKASLLAGEGALVAGSNGAIVGRFGWVTAGVVDNTGTGVPAGFVHREGQASITTWLAESSMTVQPGFQMTLMGENCRCGYGGAENFRQIVGWLHYHWSSWRNGRWLCGN